MSLFIKISFSIRILKSVLKEYTEIWPCFSKLMQYVFNCAWAYFSWAIFLQTKWIRFRFQIRRCSSSWHNIFLVAHAHILITHISQIEQIQVTKNWNNFVSKRIQNDIKPWHMVFGMQLKLPGNNSILPATGKLSRSLHFDH